VERSIMIISRRDFTEDLKAFGKEENGVKMVVLHGDNDQGGLREIPAYAAIAKLTYSRHAGVDVGQPHRRVRATSRSEDL
jgi:hypothetical protein